MRSKLLRYPSHRRRRRTRRTLRRFHPDGHRHVQDAVIPMTTGCLQNDERNTYMLQSLVMNEQTFAGHTVRMVGLSRAVGM